MITAKYAHQAAITGDLVSLQFVHETHPSFLESLNQEDCDNSLMHTAAKYGHLSIIEFLYNLDPDTSQPKACLDKRNSANHSCLVLACLRGHVAIVNFILNTGYNPNNMSGPSCLLAVLMSPEHTRIPMLDILLTSGVDPNVVSETLNSVRGAQSDKVTPLIFALLRYSPDKDPFISRILEHPKVDVNLSVTVGTSTVEINPLFLCAQKWHTSNAFEMLIGKLITMGAYFPKQTYSDLIGTFIKEINTLDFATATPHKIMSLLLNFTSFIEPKYFAASMNTYDDYTFLNVGLCVQFGGNRGITTRISKAISEFVESEEYKQRIATITANYRAWCKDDVNFVQSQCDAYNVAPCVITTETPAVPVFLCTKVYCYEALTTYTATKINSIMQEYHPSNPPPADVVANPLHDNYIQLFKVLPHPKIYLALQQKMVAQQVNAIDRNGIANKIS